MSSPQPNRLDAVLTEYLARATAAVALLTVAVIHIVDLPATIQATPLIGYGYLLLISTAMFCALAMIRVADRRIWLLADAVGGGAFLAYVLSRTTGLPTDHLDVGNWNCTLGIAAISIETLIVLLATWRSMPHRNAAPDELVSTAPLPRIEVPVQRVH